MARILMALDIVLNIGVLFIYKYIDFAIDATNRVFRTNLDIVGMVLLIGISFLHSKHYPMSLTFIEEL